MKINTSTSSVRGNILRLHSGQAFKLIISLIIPQLAGGLGSYFTIGSVKDWYPVLVKPALNPPAWIFGPVWTTLFLLMGISVFLIWRKLDSGSEAGMTKQIKIALGIFAVQLVLNALWSIIFFGLHSSGGALVEIVFLWLAILATIIAFYKISPPSPRLWRTGNPAVHPVRAFFVSNGAWLLLIPYILWVSFAGYLNYSIWVLN